MTRDEALDFINQLFVASGRSTADDPRDIVKAAYEQLLGYADADAMENADDRIGYWMNRLDGDLTPETFAGTFLRQASESPGRFVPETDFQANQGATQAAQQAAEVVSAATGGVVPEDPEEAAALLTQVSESASERAQQVREELEQEAPGEPGDEDGEDVDDGEEETEASPPTGGGGGTTTPPAEPTFGVANDTVAGKFVIETSLDSVHLSFDDDHQKYILDPETGGIDEFVFENLKQDNSIVVPDNVTLT
ncbi:hypothetical protein [Ectothiorhodospira haloalkaliphila]|nr:hypothetical protein [Ectothiorhodospira haloalkaliphila]